MHAVDEKCVSARVCEREEKSGASGENEEGKGEKKEVRVLCVCACV